MGLLLFYLLLALVVSFLCSVLEAVLLSVTPSFIEAKLSEGKRWAKKLSAFKKEIDRPLAAILSLNTISHTVGAAGVGAQAGLIFQDLSMGIISGVLTLLILVVSELIPKTLGANYWKSLALFTVQTLRVLLILMYPLVLLSQGITYLFKQKGAPSVERGEVAALAELGRREGVFSEEEAKILKNLLRLRSLTVRDIMTPRMVMQAANQKMTVKEFFQSQAFERFSRIPIYNRNKDDIVGFVHKHDVLGKIAEKQDAVLLEEIVRELPYVPESQNLYSLYRFLTQENAHVAVVVEEFGGTAGLVTMEDVLETLLGMEIMDEFDNMEDLQEYARQSWRKRAERLGLDIGANLE